MNILIISPYFKPYENPRAYRWTQVADYLKKCGHVVHVITSDDHKLGNETHGITIHRVGHSTADKAWFQNKSANRGAWIPNFIKRKVKRHIWPDESRTWISPALKLGNQICSDFKIDILISVSMPFSSHCIAFELKNKYQLPWLADIGDPFEIGKDNIVSNRRLEREKQILKSSDAITVTTKSLANKYCSALSTHANYIKVIGPMASPNPNALIVGQNRKKRATIKLGYFGTFYKNVREPHPMTLGIKLLSQAMNEYNFEIHLYGDIKAHFANKIQAQVNRQNIRLISHPNVSRADVIQTMREMDVLLSVGNKNQNQLPSKVADYVLSLTPILHFSYEPNDSVATYMNSNPLFVAFEPTAVTDISKRLLELLDNDESHENYHFIQVKNDSAPQTIGNRYLEILESILANKSTL